MESLALPGEASVLIMGCTEQADHTETRPRIQDFLYRITQV